MTFLWIGLLALILLVPILVAVYLWSQRRRQPGRRAVLEPVVDPRGQAGGDRACDGTSRSPCSRRASRRW